MLDLIGQTPMVRMSRLAKALSLPDGIELLVAMNRWFYGRSAEGEFVSSWDHMSDR